MEKLQPKLDKAPISPKGLQIAGQIKQEAQRGIIDTMRALKNPNNKRLTVDEYAQFCQEYLGGDIKDAAVNKKIASIDLESNMELRFPVGARIVLAIIPVTEWGNRLDEDDLANNQFIRELIVENDGLTRGFGNASALSSLLPLEVLKNCTFVVRNEDPRIIKSEYISAILSLQAIINKSGSASNPASN